MNPYYSDDSVALYLGDCLDVVEWLTADVLVTDPPYGMDYVSRYGRGGVVGDLDTTMRDETLRLWGAKPALVFGTWRAPRPACDQLIVWDKGNEAALGHPRWWSAHEEIYVRGTGWVGRRSPNVLRVNGLARGGELRTSLEHPTPKPVVLLQSLVMACPPGVIADPFAGTGATLLAARIQGRKAIGVEINERHAEIAARRLAQGILELDEVPA